MSIDRAAGRQRVGQLDRLVIALASALLGREAERFALCRSRLRRAIAEIQPRNSPNFSAILPHMSASALSTRASTVLGTHDDADSEPPYLVQIQAGDCDISAGQGTPA
jgi:hypothetical protein